MISSRRNFLGSLLVATAGFTILPSAGRVWKVEKKIVRPKWMYAGCHKLTIREFDLVTGEFSGPEKEIDNHYWMKRSILNPKNKDVCELLVVGPNPKNHFDVEEFQRGYNLKDYANI